MRFPYLSRAVFAIPVAWCVALVGGCGLISPLPGGVVDGNRGAPRPSSGRTSGEPNGTFGEALRAIFDSSGQARLEGTIASRDDVDVFDLGPLDAGDRIAVDVDTSPFISRLDSMIGVFDADENLFIENDDTSNTDLDSLLEQTIRYSSEHYYLVMARSPFADVAGRTGAYDVDITVTRGGTAPPPVGQTIFLDFDGGIVTADNLGVSRVPAFDAGDIDSRYSGMTDVVKETVINRFKDAFAGFDVTVFTSDDPAPPNPPFSMVLFGGPHPADLEAFGISESVDELNSNPADVSVIFTETFAPTPGVFAVLPTAEELGIAIGNVAAHEAGHLLGLSHVQNPTDVMDAVSPADTLLQVQVFKRSPLYSHDLFPIGYQDAPLLLAAIVGAT